MKPILLILCFVAAITIRAQVVFPATNDSARWNVYGGYNSFEWTHLNTVEWVLVADTTFCGNSYSKAMSLADVPFGGGMGYIRVEGEKVYVRNSFDCGMPDMVMYDFSVSIDDTLDLAYSVFFELLPITHHVTDIDTVIEMGVARQRIHLELVDDMLFVSPIIWLRGIGAIEHPFQPLTEGFSNGHTGYTLLCYWEEDQQFYQDPFIDTCYASLNTSLNESEVHLGAIYPNPFLGTSTILLDRSDPTEVEVLSMDGRILRRDRITGTSFEFGADLASGPYLVRLVQSGRTQIWKVVKVEE